MSVETVTMQKDGRLTRSDSHSQCARCDGLLRGTFLTRRWTRGRRLVELAYCGEHCLRAFVNGVEALRTSCGQALPT